MKYVLFQTAWGWMGLSGEGRTLKRLVLPIPGEPSSIQVRNHLLAQLPEIPEEDPKLLPQLRRQINDYFAGNRIDRWNCEVDYSGFPPFIKRTLQETASIPYGCVTTYGELAARSGSPRAARAVGQAMARNNTPLVVPCHRVIGSQGKLTGFSAPGGIDIKKALLQLEGLR